MKTIIIILLLCNTLLLPAQQIITTAGDASDTSNTSLQWTLGQIITGTTTDGNNILIHGFQNSTITVTNIFENADSDFSIKVYPNPVKSSLTIEIDKLGQFVLIAKLYDISGTEHSHYVINDPKLNIDFSEFSSGTYILQFYENNSILSSYKIIKL